MVIAPLVFATPVSGLSRMSGSGAMGRIGLKIIGIDQFFDMSRTATNVVGNSLATAVIAKQEDDREARLGTT